MDMSDMSIQRQGSNGIFIPLQDKSYGESQISQSCLQPSVIQEMPQSQVQQNQIIVNQQMQPKIIYVDSTNFKTNPCITFCPFCKNQIQTQVNKKCNWYSWLLCYCIGLAPWMVLQCCRNKNVNCYNAEHFCPNCGNKIAEYNSC